LASRTARADAMITGSVGGAFGGDIDQSHVSYGLALGFIGNGPLGFEIDGTYTPSFFGHNASIDTNRAATLMGNLVLSVGAGQTLRLYATGGVGGIKFRVPDIDPAFDVNQTDFGMDAGGGLLLGFGALGVRADIRWFRDLQTRTNDPTKVDF